MWKKIHLIGLSRAHLPAVVRSAALISFWAELAVSPPIGVVLKEIVAENAISRDGRTCGASWSMVKCNAGRVRCDTTAAGNPGERSVERPPLIN